MRMFDSSRANLPTDNEIIMINDGAIGAASDRLHPAWVLVKCEEC